MNRRTFLRLLSAIPLVDVPALLERMTSPVVGLGRTSPRFLDTWGLRIDFPEIVGIGITRGSALLMSDWEINGSLEEPGEMCLEYIGDEPGEHWIDDVMDLDEWKITVDGYPIGDTTLYVGEYGDDGNDGLTPETAKRTVAAALQIVGCPFDVGLHLDECE